MKETPVSYGDDGNGKKVKDRWGDGSRVLLN
jgi:hypothetical protein